MKELRERMLIDLQLSGAVKITQKNYLREVDNLARYFNRSPEELGEAELKEYLLYLMKERHLSEGTFRFYVAGLKFLYRTTLKREWPVENIRHPREKTKLPIVLDLSEVESLFAVTKNLKHKAILMIIYSSGLRVSEAARLELTDIDSKRMTVRIRKGKGGKDRYSILSQTTLEHLRQYWREYRPARWLFEGQKKCGIRGLSPLFPVQLLLGHRSPTTTTVYLHVSRHNLSQVVSPLDKAFKQAS